jgi:hypothetical protein
MPPDALPQLIDTLLRLPLLEPAQIKDLIQHLPDPQASAQEMLRRGWITEKQFASLFPGAPEPVHGRETLLVGCGDDDAPPDPDCDNWDLPVSEEEETEMQPAVESERSVQPDEEILPEPGTVETLPVLAGAVSASHFEWDLLPPAAGGSELRQRESNTDRRLRQWMRWASTGLLMWILFLGSFLAGRQFFGADSTAAPVARKESREAKKTRVALGKRGDIGPQTAAARSAGVADDEAPAGDPVLALDPPLIIQGDPAPQLIPAEQAQARLTPAILPAVSGVTGTVPPPVIARTPGAQGGLTGTGSQVPARKQAAQAGPAGSGLTGSIAQTTHAHSSHPSHTHAATHTASSQGHSGRSH